MNLEDRFYSESEVRGVPSQDIENERVYSSFEVQEITDLFSEFYSENGDHYENVDDAYSEFIDAYAVQKFEDITAEVNKKEPKSNRSRVNKAVARTGAAALGAGVGYLIALGLNKKDAKEVAEIQAKMDKGQARATDIQRMEALTKNISRKKKGGLALGAGAGLGTSYLAGKRFSDDDDDDAYTYTEDWDKTGFRNEGARRLIKDSNRDNAMTGALVGGAAASLRTSYKLQTSPKGKRLRELNAKYQLHKTNKSQKELTKEEKVELKELHKHFLLHHGKRVLIGLLAGGAIGYSANGISKVVQTSRIPKRGNKSKLPLMKEAFKFGLGKENTARRSTEAYSDNYAEDFNEDTYPVLTTAAIIGGGAALGGGIGNVSARIKNRQLKRKIKRLKGKKNLNSFQQARLDKYRTKYNKDLYRRTGKGAIVGGAAAAGGVLAGGTKAILAGAGAAKSAAAALAAKLGATGSGIKGAVGAAGGTAGSLWALNRSERRAEKAAKVAAKSHAGLGALAGTAVGAGASYLATKKLRSEIKALKAKPNKSEIDNANLKSLRRKLAVTIGAGTVAGGAAGAGIGSQIKRG